MRRYPYCLVCGSKERKDTVSPYACSAECRDKRETIKSLGGADVLHGVSTRKVRRGQLLYLTFEACHVLLTDVSPRPVPVGGAPLYDWEGRVVNFNPWEVGITVDETQ